MKIFKCLKFAMIIINITVQALQPLDAIHAKIEKFESNALIFGCRHRHHREARAKNFVLFMAHMSDLVKWIKLWRIILMNNRINKTI